MDKRRSLIRIKKLCIKKEMLEIKNTIAELNNSMKNFSSRLEQAEESVNFKTNF